MHTSDRAVAARLVNAKNDAASLPGFNRELGRTYMSAADPEMANRTWKDVMDIILAEKTGPSRQRWYNASRDKALVPLWNLRIVETRADQLLRLMQNGTVSTNVYLRRLHNFALDMIWLAAAILPKRKWPKVKYGEKRSITSKEHQMIIDREKNLERRAFYELLWELGGSQSDIASLLAEDINWEEATVFYRRKKTGAICLPQFGKRAAEILLRLPQTGPLFPNLIKVRESDRATEFKQRCQGLGITGITLHSYRYAWAERAAAAGYPERHAQSNLGHGSKAVARAYARKAKVRTPPLEAYESAPDGGAITVCPDPCPSTKRFKADYAIP